MPNDSDTAPLVAGLNQAPPVDWEMPRLLDTKQAAKMLGVCPETLCRWRKAGHGPEYIQTGRFVRYAEPALRRFVGIAA